MNQKLLDECTRALEEDIKYMGEEQRSAFLTLLPLLSKLYRNDSKVRGVMVLADEEGQSIVRMNANEYEAHGLLHNAMPFHDELIRAAQPDHGRFN